MRDMTREELSLVAGGELTVPPGNWADAAREAQRAQTERILEQLRRQAQAAAVVH